MSNPNLNHKFIWINGIQLPAPDNSAKILRQQLVDSARNANGQVVAQKINRRLLKVDGLQWSYLPAETWSTILQQIEQFTGTLKIWDARINNFTTLQIYWGDAEEQPFEIDSTGKILSYRDCKCNVIDMGY